MNNYQTTIGNSVDELRSTKLWIRLNDLNPSRAKNACDFVEYIEPYLSNIHKHFPLYTRHDCHHSYEVLNRMSEIIKDELLEESANAFSYDEIFCLIVSAYAHDVGMAVFEEGEAKHNLYSKIGLPKDTPDDNPELTRYLRKNHAERGIEFLRKEELKDIIPEYLRGLIGNIIKGHNMHPKELIREFPNAAALSRKVSNPISLAIVLCCADVLEFSDTRVIKSAFDAAKQRDDKEAQISLSEMMKHNSIGCGISVSDQGLIIATGEFNDARTLHGTHKALDEIELWLRDYIYYDKLQSKSVLKLQNYAIYRDSFTMNGFKYYPIAIKMDEFQIREILTSKNMWGGSESLPIKELLQNSIDACRYRAFVKPKHIEYNPYIKVMVNYENRTITVKDNGIGMSETDVTEFFLQIGKSKTRSSNFINNPINKGYSSLARFGIGFWSVFSIANKATIKTRYNNFFENENGVTFDVTINPLKSYLELKSSSISEGTEICLELKEDVDISRIVDELINSITVSEIPCAIYNEKSEVLFEFPKELEKITIQDIFGYRAKEVEAKGIKVFSYLKRTENVEVSLGISYSKINGEYRCLTPEGKPIFDYLPYNKGIGHSVKTSVCGLVTNYSLGTIPFAIGRVGVLIVNIKDPSGLEFSLSRRSLVQNDKLDEIRVEIASILNDALKQFYKDINIIDNANKMQKIIDDSKTNGGNVGDTRIPGLYDYYTKHYKNLVPIELLYWKKEDDKLITKLKNMFIHEFWNIKLRVFYTCIWPDRFNFQKKIAFVDALVNSVSDKEGYVLWAYQEATALVEIAKNAKVINLKIPYVDWNMNRNEVIVIEPWNKYQNVNRGLAEIRSKWSGQLLSIDFEAKKGNKPWYTFGRSIMYVDVNHDLIKHILNLINEGKMWECGDLLALMASKDENVSIEITNRTGINPLY